MNDLKPTSYLEPTNFEQAEKFAKMVAESDFAPKDFKGKPGNILVAMQYGNEIGLKPMQALQNISVINGRPTLWGDAALGLIRCHSSCKYVKEWLEGSIKDNSAIAYCEVMRGTEKVLRSFSIDQARRAGLLSKQGPWQSYPERLLQMRARGFALRDAYADLLKGMYLREELEGAGFNEQDLDSVPVKIGNEAIKNEIIEQETTTLGSKTASDDMIEEIKTCQSYDLLRQIGLKIRQVDLTLSDKKRLAECYRERLNDLKNENSNQEKENIDNEGTSE
jgi:hypothetical protein